MSRIFLLVAALIAYGSLYPWEFHAPAGNPIWLMFHSWPAVLNRFVFRDTVVNLALYMPFGLAGFLALTSGGRRRLAIAGPVLAALLFSGFIEVLQALVRSRTSSAYDVFCNVVGASCGVWLGVLFENTLQFAAARARSLVVAHRPGALLLLYCWLAIQLFPLFPGITISAVRIKAAHFFSFESFSALEAFLTFTEWTAALSLLRQIFNPKLTLWLAFPSLLLVPARLLIIHRAPTLAELAGAAAAVAACSLFSLCARRRVIAILVCAGILLRGLAPFHAASAASTFSWIPFLSLLHTQWEAGLLILARKLFWYGSAVWMLHDNGLPYKSAAAATAILLGCVEFAQIHLTGHVPEITDPLIAVLMAWILRLMERFATRNESASTYS